MDMTRAWRYMPEVTPPWVRADFDKLPPDAALVLFVDDEDEQFTFNGTNFKVHANGLTVLELPERSQHWAGFSADDVANAAEKQLGPWGVVKVPQVLIESLQHPKTTINNEGQAGLAKLAEYARVAWENQNTKWAAEVHRQRQAKVRKFHEDGMVAPPPSIEEATAEKWLKSRKLLV